MRFMRNAPAIDVNLGPSSLAGAAIGVSALATLVLVLCLPVSPGLHALGCGIVLAWAWDTFRTIGLRSGARTVVSVHLGADRLVIVREAGGRVVAGHLRSATYVAASLTTIVWRPDGAWRSRAVLVLPDMLPAEDFRRLRILLRYARSGVAEGKPLSQA